MSISFSTVSTNLVSLTVLGKVACFQALNGYLSVAVFFPSQFYRSGIHRSNVFSHNIDTYRNNFLLKSALRLTQAPLLRKPKAIHIFTLCLKSSFLSPRFRSWLYIGLFFGPSVLVFDSVEFDFIHSFLVQQYNHVTFL